MGLENYIGLLTTAALLVGAFISGSILERRHFADLERRERSNAHCRCTSIRTHAPDVQVSRSALVQGQVVVSLDYFKRFAAALKALFGGRIGAFESLLERARREAILRMQDEAIRKGYGEIINVRLETSRLASKGSNGKGTAGIEILAYGTALKLTQ